MQFEAFLGLTFNLCRKSSYLCFSLFPLLSSPILCLLHPTLFISPSDTVLMLDSLFHYLHCSCSELPYSSCWLMSTSPCTALAQHGDYGLLERSNFIRVWVVSLSFPKRAAIRCVGNPVPRGMENSHYRLSERILKEC